MLGTVVNALVVAAVGFILIRVGNGRFEDLKERFEDLKDRIDDLKERVDRMEDRLDKRIDTLQVVVEGLRSDVTAVALAVGARPQQSSGGLR